MERISEKILPKEVKPYGSTIVGKIVPTIDPEQEFVCLRRRIEGEERPLIFLANAGKYKSGDRVELTEVRFKGPLALLGMARLNLFGFSDLYARPMDSDKDNLGDWVQSFKRLP